jgi:UDP-N-acetylmuramyl pentapeptide synthase
MHCHTSLQTGKGSFSVAVLDTVHGAGIIAKEMAELGINASPFEVYHTNPCRNDFDLVVSPVHLSPKNPWLVQARLLGKRIITHHQAVGEVVKLPIPVVEITGTHSKTSSALLLAKILSGDRRVISHTTRGIELWSGGSSRIVLAGLSITPGNVIHAAKEAESNQADVLICEISLGGTGLADFGVLTSFSGDYTIAQGTTFASTAKLQMVSLAKKGFHLIANKDVKVSPDTSFGQGGYVKSTADSLNFGDECLDIELNPDLDFAGYETAICAAAASSHAVGLDNEAIASALEGFDGFAGRMKVVREEGLEIHDGSNSGLKVSDVSRAMDRLSGGRLGLVVGEESETVCEGMDVLKLRELLRFRRSEIDLLVLVGSRMAEYATDLGAKTAPNFSKGVEIAKSAGGVDRLLLCVKCFR